MTQKLSRYTREIQSQSVRLRVNLLDNPSDMRHHGYSHMHKEYEQPQPPPSFAQYRGPSVSEKAFKGYESKFQRTDTNAQNVK